MTSRGRPSAIAWYKRDEYVDVLAVMVDAHKLPSTYADWLRKARQAEQLVLARGDRPARIHVEPRKFAEWCQDRGVNLDEEGRRQFCAWVLVEHIRQIGWGQKNAG